MESPATQQVLLREFSDLLGNDQLLSLRQGDVWLLEQLSLRLLVSHSHHELLHHHLLLEVHVIPSQVVLALHLEFAKTSCSLQVRDEHLDGLILRLNHLY